MKAQLDHQKKTQKHLDSLEEHRQRIMKEYKHKLDKDAEDVRQFLAKLELDRYDCMWFLWIKADPY